MDELRQFVARTIRPVASESDARAKLPRELITTIAASGYLAWNIPSGCGGAGRSFADIGRMHYELGRVCTSTRALVTVHQVVAEVLARWGTDRQRQAWLPRMARGDTLACFALTEGPADPGATRTPTTAQRGSDGYILNGFKGWVTGGIVADVALVSATIDDSPVAFLIPLGAHGVVATAVPDLLGFRAAMVAHLRFQNVAVGESSLIGPVGSGITAMAGTGLDFGRFVTAFGALGLASECFAIAHEFATRRGVGGRSIIDHPLVRRLLAQMLIGVEAGSELCAKAAALRDNADPVSVNAAVIAKYHCAKAAAETSRSAIEVMGASGCVESTPVARFYRDAKVLEIIEGTNEILEDVIGTFWHECLQ